LLGAHAAQGTGTDAAKAMGPHGADFPFIRDDSFMTLFDDELGYLCAWGRWRIDQARNEPVLPASERARAETGHQVVVHPAGPAHRRRARARLRLVFSTAPGGAGATR
jgi:hypothetical protein